MKEFFKNNGSIRLIVFLAGIGCSALGVSMSIRAGIGTTPAASIPVVTSPLSGLSVGTMTFLLNCVFVAIQILIERKQFRLHSFIQLPMALLYSWLVDLTSGLLS